MFYVFDNNKILENICAHIYQEEPATGKMNEIDSVKKLSKGENDIITFDYHGLSGYHSLCVQATAISMNYFHFGFSAFFCLERVPHRRTVLYRYTYNNLSRLQFSSLKTNC